jgi:hypothetical protein
VSQWYPNLIRWEVTRKNLSQKGSSRSDNKNQAQRDVQPPQVFLTLQVVMALILFFPGIMLLPGSFYYE